MQLRVKKEFVYAVNGYNITKFVPQDNDEQTGMQEVPDDAAAYALKEDFAEEEGGKAVARSPEDKARKGGKGK